MSSSSIQGIDCESPRISRDAQLSPRISRDAQSPRQSGTAQLTPRKIDSYKELSAINFLLMRSEVIDIKPGEMIFYTYGTDADINIHGHIRAPFIESEYIKVRTCNILGSLIWGFKLDDSSSAIDTFISGVSANRQPAVDKYYKVCILEHADYINFKKIFDMKSIKDIQDVITIADYMLLNEAQVSKYIVELLEKIEKNAIAKYWDKLCKKPTYDKYLKFRMFKYESIEMTDYSTVSQHRIAKKNIDKRLEFYDTIHDKNRVRVEANEIFCDEIPKLDEDDLAKYKSRFSAFREKYYCPPDDKDIIQRDMAVDLFTKVFEYCEKVRKYDLVLHLYRTFAIVPDLSHAIFAKEIQIIKRYAMANSYILDVIDGVNDLKCKNNPLRFDLTNAYDNIQDDHITKLRKIFNHRGVTLDISCDILLLIDMTSVFQVYNSSNYPPFYNRWYNYLKQWNRYTGYAFYLMYVEECFHSSNTTISSRYIFTSDDVEYWTHTEIATTIKDLYFIRYRFAIGISEFVKYFDTERYVSTDAYEPFTIGNSGNICSIIPKKLYEPGMLTPKSFEVGIHSITDIKHRLLLASNGLFDDNFPWVECGLNLTGSLLVACTAVNMHDMSNDTLNKDNFSKKTCARFNSQKSKDKRFIKYIDALYTDADIDLYIDERDVAEYLKKARHAIEYIQTRYDYIVVREIYNDWGFTRFKLSQEVPRDVSIANHEKLKNIDIYMNNMGNIYRHHLPIARMSYNGERVYYYPSCLSALLTGINGNYKWFKSPTSGLDIIIKYMRRGFAIILNKEEISVIKTRFNSMKESAETEHDLEHIALDYGEKIPFCNMQMKHCLQNSNFEFIGAHALPGKGMLTPGFCNKHGVWKMIGGRIINPNFIFAEDYLDKL